MPTTVINRRDQTYVEFVRLETEICPSCGCVFAVPQHFLNERRFDGKRFYCPVGHSLSYNGDRHRLEQELQSVRRQRDFEREDRERAEASARAHKGHATRLRKRAKAGVCPCCNRTFKQLARHMANQHPDWPPESDANG